MQRDTSWSWVLPATGIAFVVLAIVAFILTGEGQDATKKTADEVVSYYNDHDTEQAIGAFIIGLAGVFFIFFAGALRRVLRAAAGEDSVLPAVSFAGAILFVAALAVGASLTLTLADLADDVAPGGPMTPQAYQAINGIAWDYFIPFSVGFVPFILASGISAVRSGALPAWLGWVAIVLGVAGYTPAGFFAFLAGIAWVLIVSILLVMRARSGAETPPAATPPAAA